jgi:hypothetical protein
VNQIATFLYNLLNQNLHWFLISGLLTVLAKNPDKIAKKYYYGLAIIWIVLTFLKGI